MLTYRDLRQIQDGHQRNADVMTLLREIKRLRDLAAQGYEALGHLPLGHLSPEDCSHVAAFTSALLKEPAVAEFRLMREKSENLAFRRSKAQLAPLPPK